MEKINSMIKGVVNKLNYDLPNDKKICTAKETQFWGKKGVLDSLLLVRFIIILEETISKDYSLEISLSNEKTFDLENSPFKNANTLAKYISQKIKGKNG